MWAATPMLVTSSSRVPGAAVGARQPGFEQRQATLVRNLSITRGENSSRAISSIIDQVVSWNPWDVANFDLAMANSFDLMVGKKSLGRICISRKAMGDSTDGSSGPIVCFRHCRCKADIVK
jgi:hypothetical protein